MALPAGITTATFTFGKDFDVLGESAAVSLKITPSHTLIWSATGDRITAFEASTDADAGTIGSFDLPHTDQAGFVNEAGDAITDWWYKIVGTTRLGQNSKTYTKNVQVTSDVETVDFDTLPINGTVGPVGSVALPTITSVNGSTGVVVLSAADVGAVPNTEAGRTALAASPELGAAYVGKPDGGDPAGYVPVKQPSGEVDWAEPVGLRGDPGPALGFGLAMLTHYDTFKRADGALGSTDSGAAWATWAGGWVVSGQTAVPGATGTRRSVIDVGLADGSVEMIGVYNGGPVMALIFRGIDNSNFLRARITSGTAFQIDKIVAGGAAVPLAQTAIALSAGTAYRISVRAAEHAISARLALADGTPVATLAVNLNSTDFATFGEATKVGLDTFNSSGEVVRSLFVQGPVSGPTARISSAVATKTTTKPDKMQAGYTLFMPLEGQQVWWLYGNQIIATLEAESRIGVVRQYDDTGELWAIVGSSIAIYDRTGTRVFIKFYTDGLPGDCHHDLIRSPGGNILTFTKDIYPSGNVDDVIVELDRTTGAIVSTMSLNTALYGSADYDADGGGERWFHSNSLDLYPNGDLLVSLRNISTLARIDWATKTIVDTWGSEVLGFQHHATVTPDGGSMCFNNGVGAGESSIVVFDDEHNVTLNHGLGFFADAFGSVQRLDNGNWLVCDGRSLYDAGAGGGRAIEYNSDFSEIVFEWRLNRGAYIPYHKPSEPAVMPLAYRAFRVQNLFLQ